MGYTLFESEHRGIKADLRFHIGYKENALVWELHLTSDEDKKIKVFPYVELAMMEFMRELQWQCYNKHQLFVYTLDDVLVYKYGVENQPKPKETPLVYFASDCKITGFDGDRDEFVGTSRSEENPAGLETGCTGSTLAGGDPCFAYEVDVDLKAGEERRICFFLGTAMTDDEIKKSVAHCREKNFVDESFAELKEKWNELDTRLAQVETVNNQAVRELIHLRASSAFINLRNKLWFEFLTAAFVCSVMIYFLGHNAEMQHVLSSYSITMMIVWLVLTCAYALYRAVRFGAFDVMKPTTQLMQLSNEYKRDYSLRRLASYPLFVAFTVLFVFFERGWIIERGRMTYAVVFCVVLIAVFGCAFRGELRRQKQLIDEVDKSLEELKNVE